MKILIGFDRKFSVAFLAFCAVVVCTAPLSADEPRRAFGRLWWSKSADEQKTRQEILDKQQKARQSIDKTVVAVMGEYVEFHKRVQQGDKAVQDAVREVKKALPDELQAAAAEVFDLPPLPVIAKAISYTNHLFSVQAPAPAEAKAEGEDVKKDTTEPEEKEKKTEAVPPLQLPRAVKRYEKIWEDVCLYRAADIMLHGEVQKLLAKAKEADELTAQDEETATALVTLANELVEAYNCLKSEKWLIDAKRKVLGIDAHARNYSGYAVKKIKLAIERHERALKEKREAEEKAKAAAAAAEKLKATIEAEQKTAEKAFANLEDAIKRLEWRDCTNTLIRLQGKMTTREGKDAVNDEIRKIDVMAGMQRHFIKHAKGIHFMRGRMLLATVTKVENDELMILKTKRDKNGRTVYDRKTGKPMMDSRESRLQWRWLYDLKEKEYLDYMNTLMYELVLKGREKTHIGPREWSDHMLGAALTLRQFYGDQKGVDTFVPVLVQKAVRGFEPSREWAVKWFPDVKLEDPDE